MVAISKRHGAAWRGPAIISFLFGVVLATLLNFGFFFESSSSSCYTESLISIPAPSYLEEGIRHKDTQMETSVIPSSNSQRDFLAIGKKHGTDKVEGHVNLPGCLEDPEKCLRKGVQKKKCGPWGHFYDTIYQSRLGPYSTDDVEPFQFLEIGFYTGSGYDTYVEFMPNAELHSMEIACIEHGPREEGKWPWDNSAEKNPNYKQYLNAKRLHCGDASDVSFLHKIWMTEMKHPDAPPLKVVVDDGAHLASHMAQSVFFWFPRIEPGGLMIVEDIQPIQEANQFKSQFLPQIMNDLHFCGDPKFPEQPCFPTLQPLLASIHCEMHICIFERNQEPAMELNITDSTMPKGALDLMSCKALSNKKDRLKDTDSNTAGKEHTRHHDGCRFPNSQRSSQRKDASSTIS
eukprot:CAMPEP_0198289906 /NCGR_PEP_ID=MMETSP1449-20131203/7945_1 /TAXON_ID=420275 /ORGANISM="Attheya septentrionalis, Strain CCMP2084" /LENGTH=402 /DNA_ID=CAMNT_0043988311 /DNA_START=54 /DNA_END=1263 /DNA_ORIENTATION=-